MPRPTRRRDGEWRVTLRVTHHLSLYELTCAAAMRWYEDRNPTLAEIREAVVNDLAWYGDDPGMRFGDQSDHEPELQTNYDRLLPLVERAYGFDPSMKDQ